jgi:DNA-binding transcriptional MerR regulator
MSNYSIKDMESITGIKAHTIRIWEKRYSLIQPERTSTNIRLYNDEELVHLINVGTLVKHGHKISKLSKLSKNEVSKVIENIAVTESNHDALISQLIDAMVELNESKFLELFDQTTHSMDFEHTIIELIFPLMERIGTMWTIGSIIPGHEHFLSNLIRQKMISNIDKLAVHTNPDKPTFLLFLPDGEWHEIGLLFMQYMLKKRGFKVLYLGASVRDIDVEEVFKIHTVPYLFTVLTTAYGKESTSDYLNRMSHVIGNRTLFVSGYSALNVKEQYTNIHFIPDYHEAKALLDGM